MEIKKISDNSVEQTHKMVVFKTDLERAKETLEAKLAEVNAQLKLFE